MFVGLLYLYGYFNFSLPTAGSVHNYTLRTMAALKSLKDEVICFPDAIEQKLIAKEFQNMCGLPNMIGAIDGSLFILQNAPSVTPEFYYSRKSNYALNGFTVVDHTKRYTQYLFIYCALYICLY